MSQIDVRDLAVNLGRKLQLLLPAEVQIQAADGRLVVTTGLATDYLMLADNIVANLALGSEDDAIIVSVASMLNDLQQIVTVFLRVPWPQAEGSSRLDFAEPHAEIRERELYIWFGPETEDARATGVQVSLRR